MTLGNVVLTDRDHRVLRLRLLLLVLMWLSMLVSDDTQFYSASFLGDIGEVIAHVSARYPKANLYAAGWSLGANILVRYLGQVRN